MFCVVGRVGEFSPVDGVTAADSCSRGRFAQPPLYALAVEAKYQRVIGAYHVVAIGPPVRHRQQAMAAFVLECHDGLPALHELPSGPFAPEGRAPDIPAFHDRDPDRVPLRQLFLGAPAIALERIFNCVGGSELRASVGCPPD